MIREKNTAVNRLEWSSNIIFEKENKIMDDNMNTNVTEASEELVEIKADDQVVSTESSKTGLTGGQKAVGLGVIGFAIFGIVQLVLLAIKGVKKLVSWVKGKKKEQPEESAEKKEGLPVIEVSNETMDKIQESSDEKK